MTYFILFALVAAAAVIGFTRCTPKTQTASTTTSDGSTSPNATNKPDADAKLIAMHTGPCFGTCPVYTLTVFENGRAQYEGDRFTKMTGVWSMQLDDMQMKTLRSNIDNANLMEMQDEYRSRIPDLAMVKITYFKGEQKKQIKGKEDRPAALMTIEKQLKAMTEAPDWKQEKAPDYGLEDYEIPDEIIVQLKDDATIEDFIKENNSRFLQLNLKERVAPNQHYYVVTYEPSVYGPKGTLEQFKRSELVVDASFNKKTKLRK